eukprot:1229875-Prymnesium_polylepis.1
MFQCFGITVRRVHGRCHSRTRGGRPTGCSPPRPSEPRGAGFRPAAAPQQLSTPRFVFTGRGRQDSRLKECHLRLQGAPEFSHAPSHGARAAPRRCARPRATLPAPATLRFIVAVAVLRSRRRLRRGAGFAFST